MKNVLTKISYMAFGCLLTLIGYHFGNVDNNSVNAQQPSEKVINNIVDKLRVRQLEVVGNDNTSRIILGTNLDGTEIRFVNADNTPQMRFVNKSDGASIVIKDTSGGKTGIYSQGMTILGPNGDSSIILLTNDETTAVSVERKSKESLKTSVNIGVLSEENKLFPFVVADFGNESAIQPTWTPIKDNEQTKKTVIYKGRTIRTKSLDLNRYRVAPGQRIGPPR